MALTQMQLIQSLGDALAWFERELNWGVPATELRHLCGRIGELYVALITNGQMATEVNQRGYDVVSKEGQRISVKTTATSGGGVQVAFTSSTLAVVDRIIVLRVNTEEMQIESMLDKPLAEVLPLLNPEVDGKRAYNELACSLMSTAAPSNDGRTNRETRLFQMGHSRSPCSQLPVLTKFVAKKPCAFD